MKNDKFKKDLIEMLSDPDVVRKIREICVDKGVSNDVADPSYYKREIQKLRSENSDLERTVESQKTDIATRDGKIEKLNRKIEDVSQEKAKIEQSLREKENQVEKLQKEKAPLQNIALNFKTPLVLFQQYKSLSEESRRQLSTTVSDRDPLTFIASLSESNRLESLWDSIRYMIVNHICTEDIPVLKKIFFYFFNLINDSLSEPVYALNDDKIGIRYDDTIHSRGYESSAQGVIIEIQLQGYYSVNTKKIVKKSVVKAE